ncbi:Secreted beta-glucosidase sun1 [Ascosphaera pollenicola]|nr:Secreted beta-glucosidase sun1 [Ascosphaera pollenicola]
MKFNSAAIFAAAGVVANAQPHRHVRHAAHHVRAIAQGPLQYAYKLDDRVITQAEACQGIKDGTLVWADGSAPPSDVCDIPAPAAGTPVASGAATSPVASTSSAAAETPAAYAAEFFPQLETTSSAISTPLSTEVAATPSPEPATSATPSPGSTSASASSSASPSATSLPVSHSSDSSNIFNAVGLDKEFPDGEISCDTFPSEYGPISLDYLNLGGWSGIQDVTVSNGAVSNIVTGNSGPCKEGNMCSYSCPPGYQKSQWPTEQGSTGQSVGGLECRGGKLYLTNPSLSKNLCIQGTGNVYVKNSLSDSVAVCRTDYPGTESETIPLLASPGGSHELTSPDESTYYKWTGKPTSAQYYVNKKGVSIEEGCTWGNGDRQVGNWAPVNLGVGKSNGATWVSIMPNKPTTNPDLDFKIKIEGSGLSATCEFEGGKFYLNGQEMDGGCTTSFSDGGEAYYVFY